jgi:hypothetical protein
MNSDEKMNKLLEKIKKVEKEGNLDLSSDEDLSIGIMNLISIEEHLFFTAQKTGKVRYYDILKEVREMRKSLLKTIIKDYEGEVWCISKHLLAASMRLMEVGTKAQTKGEDVQAHDFFKKSWDLYNLFWAINLGKVKANEVVDELPKKETPIEYVKKDFLGNLSKMISKMFDCCSE